MHYLTLVFPIFDIVHLDDGGGMDPEAMRHCMSFGFSDKKSKSAIGHCTASMLILLHYLLLLLFLVLVSSFIS